MRKPKGELLKGTFADGSEGVGFAVDLEVADTLFEIAAIEPSAFVAQLRKKDVRELREGWVHLHAALRDGGFHFSLAQRKQSGARAPSLIERYKALPHGKPRLDFLNKHRAAMEAELGSGSLAPKKSDPAPADLALVEEYKSLPHGKERLAFLKKFRARMERALGAKTRN